MSIFISVDPLAEEFVGWTPYHYVHQNPINLIDPTGMSKQQGGYSKKKTPIKGVPDFFNSNFDQDKLVENLGKAMGINAHFIYSSVNSNVGGYYDRDNNTIMISNKSLNPDNKISWNKMKSLDPSYETLEVRGETYKANLNMKPNE